MKTKLNQLLTVSLLLLGVAVGAQAAIFGDDEKVLWKSGGNLYIKYAEQDSSSFGPNDHPVTLSKEKISTVLEALKLRVEESGLLSSGVEEEPVFSIGQARRLAEYLAIGLKNAKPNQDIIFTLQKEVSQLIFLTDRVFVAGRAFYKDGKLNIIIGDYNRFQNVEYEHVYDSSGQLGGAYNFNHGFRTNDSSSMPGNLMQFDGVQNKVVKGDIRQNWFVIELSQAVATIGQQNNRDQAQGQGVNSAATRQMRLEAARMQKQQRELKLEMARMREQMQNSGNGSGGGNAVQQRLETLQSLYDQKLISKEEYEVKREEILNEL